MSGPAAPPTIAVDARKIADYGIGTYVRGLLGALARLDGDSRYLLLAPAAGPELLPGLPANFSWVEEDSPGYSLREQWSVGRKLARHRVDLFHSPHYVLPARTPARVVVTIHDLIHLVHPEFLPHPLALLYARFFLRRAVRRAATLLTVSAATAKDLETRLGVDPRRIEVTWNGVDESFRRSLAPAELGKELAELGLAPGYFLFLGNPKPHKNLERVVRAFARAFPGPANDRRLVVAGGDDVSRDLARWSAELGLGERLRKVGRLAPARLPALVQGALTLVFPSLYEGFGLPVAEAMAIGTPVLASTTPALVEIAGGAAELVDPLDTDAIAAGMVRLATDPDRREALSRAGRLRAADFRWERTAAKTLAVYRRALAGGNAGL
ncbi:MAG: glycosyltransferase family 1 protein [Thermoanaerobaculia bacterium]